MVLRQLRLLANQSNESGDELHEVNAQWVAMRFELQ